MISCDFCTCENKACKLHPCNHDEGCTPCIRANLKTQDIPTCFFNLVEGAGARSDDSFRQFAQAVLQGGTNKNRPPVE